MQPNYRARRFIVLLIIAIVSLTGVALHFNPNGPFGERALPEIQKNQPAVKTEQQDQPYNESALAALDQLPVKGRAPKTNYARTQFGDGWQKRGGCDLRNIILRRDLTNVQVDDQCKVLSGILQDPYTGKVIQFERGPSTSADVQIDHVVALSNAWQTGAQALSPNERLALANDPLELVAVDGMANQQKSDGDAATWLPSNKNFRCQYVARQIAVKINYRLWVTAGEYAAMQAVLESCPNQKLPNKS